MHFAFIKVRYFNRIIQDRVSDIFIVEQFLRFESDLTKIESKASNPEVTNLNVQWKKMESHATPECYLGLLGVINCGCVDEPNSCWKNNNVVFCSSNSALKK